MSRVLVLGATGFVGGALVPQLRTRGHEVVALTRRVEACARLEDAGALAVVGDLRAPAGLAAAVGPVDVMVLLAAPRIFGKRLGAARFHALKTEITAIYAGALELARARACPIVITAGTSYRTEGAQVADETWPIARVGAARIGEDIDPLVARVVAVGAPKVVWMLPGQIYGPGGMLLKMIDWARRGRSGIVGDGANRVPRVHVDDCAAAYVAAVERIGELATGERFIVADDVACTTREFMDLLADLLALPRPRRAPGFIVKLLMGELLYETATMSCRVSNAKARRVLGWAPRYPGYREGLQATVAALRARGR